MKRLWLYLVLMMSQACTSRSPNPVTPFLEGKKAAVFVFLATDCPLSQSYTLTLNELSKEYEGSGVRFVGVFSGSEPQKGAVDDFVKTYNLKFQTIKDPDFKLADFLHASKTPEAFLVNSTSQAIYKGAIDDWAPELGLHRTVVTKHYLKDALDSMLSDKPVVIKETQAVGCFIERPQG
jgi:thiol-disulfide isomerase/thioredoxin